MECTDMVQQQLHPHPAAPPSGCDSTEEQDDAAGPVAAPAGSTLQDLPEALLLTVLSFCSAPDIVAASLSCKALHSATRDGGGHLWR